MQELVVIFLVVMSCYILYKYSLPDFCKYHLLFPDKLLFSYTPTNSPDISIHSENPGYPGETVPAVVIHAGTDQDQTTHIITFLKKEPDHSVTENR